MMRTLDILLECQAALYDWGQYTPAHRERTHALLAAAINRETQRLIARTARDSLPSTNPTTPGASHDHRKTT